MKRLTKSDTDCRICGVCGGIAEYIEFDPTIIRLLYACLTVFSGCFPGVILYLMMGLIIPHKN